MKYLIFVIKTAVEDFTRNKIRTFLTSLGILIGVSSVILLIAFGLGLKKFIKNQFESLGTNLVIVLPGQVLGKNGGFSSAGTAITGIRFDEKDYLTLKRLGNVRSLAPVFVKSMTFTSSANSESGELYATTTELFDVRILEAEEGSLFSKTDEEKRSKKAVIGPKIAQKLFGNAKYSLGKVIKADKLSYKITGVLKSKGGGGFGGPDFDSFVYVPYKTAQSINPDKTFYAFYIKAENENEIPTLKKEISNLLLRRYKDDEFSVVEQTEILNAVQSIFAILNMVLVAIAAISLIVGGIGIMNIMYVSVTERIREIGIRRAIGAKKRDILIQFLAESLVLSLFGGLMGLFLSFGVVLLIQRFFPAYINFSAVVTALGVSSLIGIFFGVFPARKASNLTPVEAMRND